MDLCSTVMDEICLEGLDGITMPSLWTRLECRFATIASCLDVRCNDVQSYIFENVIKNEAIKCSVQLFELPRNRSPLRLYNRYDYVNSETGTLMEDSTLIPDDIYGEVTPISDEHIRGSCNDYKERRDITQRIIAKNMSLNGMIDKFGSEKVVIVANQLLRNVALMGTCVDPCLEMTPIVYCILERIGRQRFLGEITVGKESGKYKATPKTLFYYRKTLIRKKLIMKKQCIVYNMRSVQNNHGLVFTLKRFFVQRLTPMEINAKRVCETLSAAHNNELNYDELRNHLDIKPKHFREMITSYLNNFKVYEVKNENGGQVKRFVKLIKSIGEEADDNEAEEGEDGEEDNDEYTSVNSFNGIAKLGVTFSAGKILADRPLLSQALAIIESNHDGISMKDIGTALSLPKLETRSLTRYLEKLGDISTVMVDRGRQKVSMFIPRCRTDDAKSIFDSARKSLSINETDTIGQLRRANIILDFVKEVKIVDRIFTLKKLIRDAESGREHKIDTKSVIRIVHKLAAEGHLRSIRTSLRYQDNVKKLHFVCVPSITPESAVVKEKMNQWKFQWIGRHCFEIQSDKPVSSNKSESPKNNLSDLQSKNHVMNLVYMPSIARKYGLEPKMKKILTLYRFLYYLTYDFTANNLEPSDWRYNITPLPDGIQTRVCTIGEIIPRLPLSIFVKIVWISYVIPGLQDFLNDPININLTLSQIPPSMRQCLLFKRKFAFNICEGLAGLSYLDLVETQYQEQFPKETTIITVKNRTSLTCNQKVIHYEFKSMNDFERYAEDLQYHCFKPCKDCCIDQRLYPHNLRNWTYTPSYKTKNSFPTNRLQRLSGSQNHIENNDRNVSNHKRKNNNHTIPSKKSRKESISPEKVPTCSSDTIKGKKAKKKNNSKTVKLKKKNHIRKRCYDTIDLKAKRLLKKKRTDWTPEEDAFLLVCKVASTLLDPQCPHYICVSKNVVRDELHKYSPNISRDKTALACQRRVNYMLKNPNTRQNVSDCIGEFRQDDKLQNIIRPNVPKTHEDVWNEAYINLLHLILNKMQSPYLHSAVETVIKIHSKEDLLSRFTIVNSSTNILPVRAPMHEDSHNVVDIHVNVVTNVLLASLLSKYYLYSNDKDDSNYFSQTLFKIYQRYPDSLIRSVVAKLGKYGIMTKLKKKSDPNSLKSKGVTPYRISQHFLFLLQTKFTMESLLLNNAINESDICVKEGKTGFDAALVTTLFTSKSAAFDNSIPDNIVILTDNCPLTTTVRNSVKNPNDSKCSSRYALHVLRQHINLLPSDRTQHSQDYLVVNQCKVMCSSINQLMLNKMKFEAIFNKHKSRLMADPIISDNHTNRIDKCLLDFIKTKRELGASYEEILLHSKGIWPQIALALAENSKIVYRVGIRTFRWVYIDYMIPWFVQSPIFDQTESNYSEYPTKYIKFVARYWKRPDGVIDNKVLFKFLSGVLGHIMSYPSVTKQKIIEHFNQSLQPVQLFEIIELLQASNCVSVIQTPQMSKPKLFETKICYYTNNVIHYEATPNAFIYLCRLKQYLNL